MCVRTLKYPTDVHDFVSDNSAECRASYKINSNHLSLESREPDIRVFHSVDIANVDLVVFFGNKVNKMCPCCGSHSAYSRGAILGRGGVWTDNEIGSSSSILVKHRFSLISTINALGDIFAGN
jgi:hypothetical protein